ncbi:MAG: sigma-70 family RNA polymerase sigma factor [Clostridia bacterium]|nr:sigma-70 family RNA polymerase sigma factor [Clostridia bacterium]
MLDAVLGLFRDIFFFVGYVGENGSFPEPLSQAEEREALLRLREGDAAARAKLIEHNLRLVAHVAKKYAAPRRDQDDLISIGTVGLIKAVSTFDLDKNRSLATYAARCIENAILSQMRLWFRINPPRAKKNTNGVFWHRFPRIFTSFAPLRTAM